MSFLVSLAFLSIGVYLFYWSWHQNRLWRHSQHWPHAKGKVLVSELIDAKPNQNEYSTLNFLYQYEIKAQVYTGEKINHFGLENNMSIDQMKRFVLQYPAQCEVQVSYNPTEPSDCVLLANDRQGKQGAEALGAILLLAGAFFLFLSWF